MTKPIVLLPLVLLVLGCCPLGTTSVNRDSRPDSRPGAGFDQGTEPASLQDCGKAQSGVLAMWRDQCRNPALTDRQIRDRAEPMAARYGKLLSSADLATECAGLLAGKGGFADFARQRGAQLESICLDDKGVRPQSRSMRTCKQIGF